MNPRYVRYRVQSLSQKKLMRAERKRQGLCTECGQHSDRPKGSLCSKCIQLSKERISKMITKRANEATCIRCASPNLSKQNHRLCDECRKTNSNDLLRYRDKIKDIVFASYGGYQCACCGETRKSMLQLDHLENDGSRQRVAAGCSKGGIGFYRWIVANNFPKILQVLCANCNWSKKKHGVCEHQIERAAAIVQEASDLIKSATR